MRSLLGALAVVAIWQVPGVVQTGPGTIEGRVTDMSGAVLPGVTVTVSAAAPAAPRNVVSNARGQFELAQLAAGEYGLTLSLPGFRSARGSVNVKAGLKSAVTFEMAIGSLAEQVNVRAPAPVAVSQPPRPADATVATPIRVGGEIREPRKIFDVKPVYPADANAAGLEGDIYIEAVVTRDGSVAGARVVQGVPLLNTAALEAVRQWRFTPTTLNGVPTEVSMTVKVSFSRQ
jgi:TonB family protein